MANPRREGTGRGKRVPESAKEKFLELLSKSGKIVQSAALAGHDPRTFYRIAERDPEFKAAWEEAYRVGGLVMLDEVYRRGVEGWDEEVFGKEGPIGTVRKYDSNLLMFGVKGRLPEYKDNPKIAVLNQQNVQVEDRSALIDDVRRMLVEAGVNLHNIIDGGRSAQRSLPAASPVLAEPSDVQR